MRIFMTIPAPLADQRGIALIAVALWMTAFFALTAVGVDVGRVAFTASEVQSAADVAALAGARALIDGANAQTAANILLGSGGTSTNTVNGQSAYGAATTTVVTGTVTNAGVFTAGGGAAANAAQATAVTTVTNLFTGVFGGANGTTTVTKVATAALTSVATAPPSLPMAIASGCFNTTTANCTAGNCPALNAQTDDAGFTAFAENANKPNVEHYMATVCGGDGQSPGVLSVGTTINLHSGNTTPLFDDIHCMVCTHNMTEFLVAVINKACGANFNQSGTITGFAKVTVDKAAYCAGDNKNVILQSVREAEQPGTVGGGTTYGLGQIRLIG